jgi:hypothetical protein
MSLLLGGPHILPDGEIARVIEKFKSYGLQTREATSAAPDA